MKKLWLFALTLACLSACNTVPEGVIDTDKMAELMADIHQANAVVELNPNTYTSDSVKMSLKKPCSNATALRKNSSTLH